MASNAASITGNTNTDSTFNFFQGCSLLPSKLEKLNNFKFCLPDIEVIGREEEEAELKQLLKDHKRVVISGIGGLGKTSLAAHSARNYSSDFIEHVIFIDAETPDTIKSAFNSLGLHPDINITNFEKLEKRVQIEQIYRVFGDTPTIVIFDNVTSYPTIKKYLPPKHKSNIYALLTAQLTEYESFYLYRLPLLKEQSCMELMENKFEEHWESVKHQEAELKELIVIMEYHSLAIIQAVAYIREKLSYETRKYTIQNYLEEFKINFENIKLPEHSDEEYKYDSVYTALVMNISLLKNVKDHGVEAETALHSMAYLNPSHIKPDMLLVIFNSDTNIRDAVIRILKKYSLIDIISKWSESYVAIHRLIQKTCQVKDDVYLKNGLIMAISSNIKYHWNFLEQHIKHFKLCDFDECYKEAFKSGRCRKELEEALRAVGYDYSAVEGWTAAHYSASEGSKNMLRILKERGLSFSELSGQGWTILHAACLSPDNDFIQNVLLRNKLEHTTLNKQTREKDTALHILMKGNCYTYNISTSALLLGIVGCDLTLCNKDGYTAIELAAIHGHSPILENLLSVPGADVIFNKHYSSVNKCAEENYIALFRQTPSPGEELRVWYKAVHLEPLQTLEEGVTWLKEQFKERDVSDEICLDIVKLFDNVPTALRIAAAYMLRKNVPADQFPDHLNTLPEDTVFHIIKESIFGYRCYNICKLLCNILMDLIEEQPLAFKIITFALCVNFEFNLYKFHELFDGKECLQDIYDGVVLLRNWCLFDSNDFTDYSNIEISDLVKPIVFHYSLEQEELKAACARVITSQIMANKDAAVRYLGCSGLREVYMKMYGSDPSVIQSNLDARCGGERLLIVGDLSQWSALHWAVYLADEDVSAALLRLGASINAETDDKITPLHLAMTNFDNVLFFMMKGALLTAATNQHSVTPLHMYAMSKPYMKHYFKLSLTYAEVIVKMKDGRTPLHLAAANRNFDVNSFYIFDKGGDVDICDNQDNTPAHAAASAGRPPIVKWLRDHGADLNKTNCAGETPLTILSAKNLCLDDSDTLVDRFSTWTWAGADRGIESAWTFWKIRPKLTGLVDHF